MPTTSGAPASVNMRTLDFNDAFDSGWHSTRNRMPKMPIPRSLSTVNGEFFVGAHHRAKVTVVLEVRQVVQQEEEQEQHESG